MADRTIERADRDGWTKITFEEIKKGDKFRAFEPDGRPVEDGCVFTALADAKEDGSVQIASKEPPQ